MANLPTVNALAPSLFVLLRLRWVQLCRALPTYGIVLIAPAVVGAVWLLRKAVLQDGTNAPYIASGALLVVWGMHQRRHDLHFLHRHVPQARVAMSLEYGAMVLPVVIGLLLAAAWSSAAAMCVALVFPWSPVAHASGVRSTWLRKRIPSQLFEWKSLLQSTHAWSLLLWLTALGFSWLPVLPMFLLGVLALMACGAQEQCEPRAMLLATSTGAHALLRRKVLGSVWIMLVLQLPILLAATVFQPHWWWIHGLFGLGMLVLVAYAVVLKYANYRPSERLEANGANVTVAAVFAILPGLGLVPLIMLLNEWRNARANLNTYFHAHDR